MSFPPSIGAFQRISERVYKADGRDISVGYNLVSPAKPVVATVYVYPAPSLISIDSPQNVVADARAHLTHDEFVRREQEVLQAHPGAVILDQRQTTLDQGSINAVGWHASFTYVTEFGAARRAIGSELYVFCFVNGPWALEYRFSYPRGVIASADIADFVRTLRVNISTKSESASF